MDCYLIVKVFFNKNSSNVIVGICGSCFFVSNKIAITACHILNKSKFPTVKDYDNTQFFIFSKKGQCFPMEYCSINFYPDFDTTVISFNNKIKPQSILKVRKEFESLENESISCEGFESAIIHDLYNTKFNNGKFDFDNFSIKKYIKKTSGHVTECFNSNIQGNDINLKNIRCLKASFGGIVGMSGAPFVDSENRVVALASYGLPKGSKVKDFIVGISIVEIIAKAQELSFI